MSIRIVLVVALLLQPGWSPAADFKPKLPAGLQEDAAQIPDDNPITPEKVALGKKFFWDTRWSASGTVACVSCHRPEHGWSDSRRFSTDFAGPHENGAGPPILAGGVLWSVDYPHQESVFGSSHSLMKSFDEQLGPEAGKAIVGGNAARLYQLDGVLAGA